MASSEQPYDEEKEDYLSLLDEMNDPDENGNPRRWDESHWDVRAVANAKRYAKKNGLQWPPSMGGYDRWWDIENNEGHER
jgi:hypothetical protein